MKQFNSKASTFPSELVQERAGEGKGQRLSWAVHVTDALFLGGNDIRGLDFKERMDKVELMTRSLIKLTCRDLTPVRTKAVHELKQMGKVCAEGIKERSVKGKELEDLGGESIEEGD